MNEAIAKLATIGSRPFCGPPVPISAEHFSMDDLERCGLMSLLRLKNGFYAFEGALRVRPSGNAGYEIGIEEWNSSACWRADYEGIADGCLFFAEDVFGSQFCLYGGSVMSFDPETGDKTFVAADVEEWANMILKDYDVLTGHPLAHEWQVHHGRIPSGQQLIPKLPFVLGGEFAIENMFLLEATKAMRSRANLAVQIRDLPDGTQIEFKVVE